MTNGSTTTAIATGRRDQWRSPYGKSSGTAKRYTNANVGSPMMTRLSASRGMSARSEKYPRKYQSGRGSARTTVGSAVLPSGGAPTTPASTTTITTATNATIASRYAASG